MLIERAETSFFLCKTLQKDFILGFPALCAETSFELIIPMMMADIIGWELSIRISI